MGDWNLITGEHDTFMDLNEVKGRATFTPEET